MKVKVTCKTQDAKKIEVLYEVAFICAIRSSCVSLKGHQPVHECVGSGCGDRAAVGSDGLPDARRPERKGESDEAPGTVWSYDTTVARRAFKQRQQTRFE